MDEQQQLTNAYYLNRPSRVYLFEGDDARAAKQVIVNSAELILCQINSQCETKASVYSHPDFTYISTTENMIKKEQTEQPMCHMNQLPTESTNKVHVIEDFEELTAQGEDSILKFLEEPPDNMVTILLPTKPGQVLDIIHSRCRHIYFKPIDKKKSVNRLAERNTSKPVAEMISIYATQTGNAMALDEEFGLLALRKLIIRWCELLPANKPMVFIGIADSSKQVKNKKLQSLTVAAVNGFFEDIIHTKVNIENKQIYSDLKNDIDQYAQKLSFSQLILMFDQLTETRRKLN